MARTKSAENERDPATGRLLPEGVTWLGERRYRARKSMPGNHRIGKTFETARLAREWLENASAEVRRDEYVDRRPLDALTVKDLVHRYVDQQMQDGGPRRGAAEDRASHIPSIVRDPKLADLKLADLGPGEVCDWRDRLLKKVAPATVVKRMNLLSTIISHARGEWRIPMRENPATAANAKRPAHADVKRDRRLNLASSADVAAAIAAGKDAPLDEEARLLAAVAKSCNPADILMVRFAIYQATRRGEATGLRWSDVDIEGRVLTLHGRHRLGTKTNDHRENSPEQRPMMWETANLLSSMLPKDGSKPDPDEVVFKVGDPTAFSVRVGRMMKKAGLQGLRYHDLRREATTRLSGRYKSHAELRRVTGHSDSASMGRYFEPRPGELARKGDDERG